MASGGGSESEQWSRPWSAQQPYLQEIYGRARRDIVQEPLSYYPGSTVAPRDPATLEAEQAMLARSRAGSPLLTAAQTEAGKTISGDYLTGNPYLDAMYGRAASNVTREFNRAVLPNLESRFAGANRLGSGAHIGGLGEAGRVLASELAGMATEMYGGEYARERDRQLGMVGAAAPLSQADYYDPMMMGQVGAAREAYGQATLEDLISRFEFARDEPYNRLARYSTMIGAPVQESYGRSNAWNFGIFSCWVAAEYFGWFTPDWWKARDWIMEGWKGPVADLFRKLYHAHGEWLAGVVRRNPVVKAALKPIFTWALRKGRGG